MATLFSRNSSDLIKGTIRNYDLLARYGGEEFIVLLPGVGPDNAKIVAEKIREKTQKCLFSDGQANIRITVSIGIASVRPAYAAVNKVDFVGYADEALYQAKNTGRNKVVCYKFAREKS